MSQEQGPGGYELRQPSLSDYPGELLPGRRDSALPLQVPDIPPGGHTSLEGGNRPRNEFPGTPENEVIHEREGVQEMAPLHRDPDPTQAPETQMHKFYRHLDERRKNPQKPWKFGVDIAIETLGVPLFTIPGLQFILLLPWGATYTTGDALNIAEAAVGKTIAGKKLTLFERGLYVIGAVAPIVPGRLVVAAWEQLEDTLVYPALKRAYEPQPPKRK